ncbi:protein MADS AFFECTING FLOWERING 5-like [Herrania umbratica]|uniref:Protein MADS AFFECTING FLOWERING 5-like n=1 Tax=Herrania umbratica TaxID=108875 RepID=A0A6J1ANH7_9ROSI|nr:protein MADS AFFECTING FLOWERING 5-like [Herrania umbratica]
MDAGSTSKSRLNRKGSGRRRIEIKKIENQRRRWVAFSKRKKGLLKKAAQLSMLTGDEIGVIIISEQGRVYTSDNADAVIHQYLSIKYDGQDDNDTMDDEEKERGKGVMEDGFWRRQPVDVQKIDDGKQNLQEIKLFGEALVDLKKNVVEGMEEIKGKEYLFDLNKTPDEQFC